MPNLILRVGLALAIVGVAIGMTAAASETVSLCGPSSCSTGAADAYARPGGPADIAVMAGSPSVPASATAVDASMLVGLVTVLFLEERPLRKSYAPPATVEGAASDAAAQVGHDALPSLPPLRPEDKPRLAPIEAKRRAS